MEVPEQTSFVPDSAETKPGQAFAPKSLEGAHEAAAGAPAPEAPKLRYDLRILLSLRRVIRAVDIHSRKLAAEYQITGPQLLCLMTIAQEEFLTLSSIARRVHLSSSTVIGILDRLEKKGLIRRERDLRDRRLVNVMATDAGRDLVEAAPSPLQDALAQALKQLPELEQSTIALSLERIVDLMEAKDIEPAPFLDTGTSDQDFPEDKTTG